jgi:hypothetical protein
MEFERVDAEDEIRQMLDKANRDAEEARLRAKGEIWSFGAVGVRRVALLCIS